LLLCSLLKSILGRSPKVRKSIETPSSRRLGWEAFTLVTCQSARYNRCIEYVSVTVYVLALSYDSGFSGFGWPGVVFFLIEFPLR
jgi:hypothetical protein